MFGVLGRGQPVPADERPRQQQASASVAAFDHVLRAQPVIAAPRPAGHAEEIPTGLGHPADLIAIEAGNGHVYGEVD